MRKAFTLVEALAVVAVIAILAAILLPTMSRVKAKARSAKCQSNLRQIGSMAQLYANDNQFNILPMYYPYDSAQDPLGMRLWTGLLAPYVGHDPSSGSYPSFESQSVFVCPEHPDSFGYGHNFKALSPFIRQDDSPIRVSLVKQVRVSNPAETVFMTDVTHEENGNYRSFVMPPSDWADWESDAPYKTDFRHPGKTANVLWFDGHVTAETGNSPFTDKSNKYWDLD